MGLLLLEEMSEIMSEGGVTGKQEKAQECQLFPTTNVARGMRYS